jgi:DNA-binding transcriptional LysR family regulator
MEANQGVLNGITVLSAIVKSGSFAAASEVLNMSPSGVSRAVSRFESSLGIRLFDRTTRRIMLTEEGRRFYEQVRPLVEGLEDAVTEASQGATKVRGRLRVNVDPLFCRLILGPRLGAFMERYPDLQLELITRDQLGDIIAEGFDLAVRFGHPRLSNLVARKLMETKIITVAAPSYIKKHGKPASPKELLKHTCIQFRDPETGKPFPWEFHRGGRRIVMDTPNTLLLNDGGTLHSTCLAGYGIAQIMSFGSEQFIADGQLVNLFPQWGDETFPLYAFYPSRHQLPAKTRAFLDYVATLVCS